MSFRRSFFVLLPLVACAANPDPAPGEQATADELTLGELAELVGDGVDRRTPDPSNPWAQTTLGIGEEYRLPGEDQEFAEDAALVNEFQRRAQSQDGASAPERGFHNKQHACMLGTLTVDVYRLPEYARVGLFARDASYKTWARFSSGASNRQSDTKADARGLAFKVMGVPGERIITQPGDETATTQDFLLFNQSVAPAPDVRRLLAFADAVTNAVAAEGFLGKIGSLARTGDFLTRSENIRTVDFLVNRVVPSARYHGSLIGQVFSTALPHALGLEEGNVETARAKGAMKVGARVGTWTGDRCDTFSDAVPNGDDDFLAINLEEQQRRRGLCVQLSMQLQEDARYESIEDGSVEWITENLPWGTIRFEQGWLDTSEGMDGNERCRSFAFTPWHTLAAHRPLGHMMRARRVVLPASQELRGADTTEPTN